MNSNVTVTKKKNKIKNMVNVSLPMFPVWLKVNFFPY